MENPIGDGAAGFAMTYNVSILQDLEVISDRLSPRMASVEQKANDYIQSLRNNVAFLLTYSGGGIYFQKTQVSCLAVSLITGVFMLGYIAWISLLTWEAFVKLRYLIPLLRTLAGMKEKLVTEARWIKEVENARIGTVPNEADELLVDFTVSIEDFITRCKLIEETNTFWTGFEWYNNMMLIAMVICVLVNGATLCCIAYFSYCGADASKLLKPEDPTTYYACNPYNILCRNGLNYQGLNSL